MKNEILSEHSHRRFNILTGDWIQVSPHRAKRPWQGQVEELESDEGESYDDKCYLCPGNKRIGGEVNPEYDSTYVFVNDFAALQKDIPEREMTNGLIRAKSEKGFCKVICFSPKHNLTLPEMSIEEINSVVKVWISEYTELSKLSFINHVQIFENKGALMGCSNPHPHGQIWAQESIPTEVMAKQERQLEYFEENKQGLLEDYLKLELTSNERVLFQNEYMAVIVPFWAVWPYETMIVPKRRMSRIIDMTKDEQNALSICIRWITIKYDNLFKTSFPYSSGIHQAPSDGEVHDEWHWHMSFYPPLLRSASIKKFMVGYEMFANPQRDVTPEWAAEKLRELPEVHYRQTISSK